MQQFYKIEFILKSGKSIDVTKYVASDVSLSQTDGLVDQLSFSLYDNAILSDAVTLGMQVSFSGGTLENARQSFFGAIKEAEPTFAENGEVTLNIICQSIEWVGLSKKGIADVIYPSVKNKYSWATDNISASSIIFNLCKIAGISRGTVNIESGKDITYTIERAIRQHNKTDLRFMFELADKIKAVLWFDYSGTTPVYNLVSITEVTKTISDISFFYPRKIGDSFAFERASKGSIQVRSIKVNHNRDKGINTSLNSQYNAETGETTVHKSEYNIETHEWQEYVLNEEKLRLLPVEEQERLISMYEDSKLVWDDIKDYFMEVGSAEELSSREQLVVGSEVTVAGTENTHAEFSSYDFDEKELAKLSPEAQVALMDKIRSKDYKFSDISKYFKKKEAVEDSNTQHESSKDSGSASTQKYGLTLTVLIDGDTRIKTKRNYLVQGILKYSGKYYLKGITSNWGRSGYTMSLTLVK